MGRHGVRWWRITHSFRCFCAVPINLGHCEVQCNANRAVHQCGASFNRKSIDRHMQASAWVMFLQRTDDHDMPAESASQSFLARIVHKLYSYIPRFCSLSLARFLIKMCQTTRYKVRRRQPSTKRNISVRAPAADGQRQRQSKEVQNVHKMMTLYTHHQRWMTRWIWQNEKWREPS